MLAPLPERRIVRGAANATLSFQGYDADGEPAAPGGAVTVDVARSDGTALYTDSAATDPGGTAPHTFALAATDLTVVDRLSVTWKVDGTVVRSELVDVVGGTIGTVAEIQATEASLGDDTAAIPNARKAAEDRFTWATRRSPFQRLHVERFDGRGGCRLAGAAFRDLAEVRWARIWTSATDYTELTAAELAAIVVPDEDSRFHRTDAGRWPAGRNNIEIGYVFGLPAIDELLRDALHMAVRWELQKHTTTVPQRSQTFQTFDGINVGLARPGKGDAIYGIDEIDAVYWQYMRGEVGIA